MCPDLGVVSTPSLHFRAGVVKAHETVRVQALHPELAIERRDEAVFGGLAGPGEVEDGAILIGTQIEITAHQLRALVNPDFRWIADGSAEPFKGQHHVLTPVAEPRIDRRREPGVGIDDRKHADLSPGRQLVVNEVHGPGLVRSGGRPTIVPQLRLHPALWHVVPQLQSQFHVKTIDPLRIDRPLTLPPSSLEFVPAVGWPC